MMHEPVKALKLLPMLELPKIPGKGREQTLQEWHAAGGSVPMQYKSKPHVWHAKVKKYAEGGSVGDDTYGNAPDDSDGGAVQDAQHFADGGAAFGKYPAMKASTSKGNKEAQYRLPLDVARGAVAGVLGAPADFLNIPSSLYRGFTGKDSYKVPFGSEEIEEHIPFRGEEPVNKLGAGFGTLLGGLVSPTLPLTAAAKGAKAVGRGALDLAKSDAAHRVVQKALSSPLMAPSRQMNVVKEPGGNWLSGAGSPEQALESLKRPDRLTGGRRDPKEIMAEMKATYTPEALATMLPETKAHVASSFHDLEKKIAMNDWVDRNLTNYVKKQMGTVDDPVRKLAEEGIVHIPTNEVGINRYRAPERRGYQSDKQLGKSEAAKAWEDATDVLIGSDPASSLTKPLTEYEIERGYKSVTDTNPWLTKVAPETPIHSISMMGKPVAIESNLGFDHILDVLREDVTAGRIRPEQLNKVSMEQAVRRTYEYDQELAKAAEAARAKTMEGMTVHKAYPEGYKWVQLDQPGQFAQESDVMGHSVRGYEPPRGHPDYIPESGNSGNLAYGHGGYEGIKSGQAKVYSLRDPKGMSHATVEVGASKTLTPEKRTAQMESIMNRMRGEGMSEEQAMRQAEKLYPESETLSRITQIKGKSNAAPKREYQPYIQDFVKSGKWSDVGDLHNSGFVRIDPESEMAASLKAKGKDVPPYITQEELTELSDAMRKEKGLSYSHGGEVHMAGGGGGLAEKFAAKLAEKLGSGVSKVSKAVAEAPKGVEPIVVRTPEERAVIDKFGQKQEQEAVRQKKVEKAAKESAKESAEESPKEQAYKAAKSTGKRVAVTPDFYRKMASDLGEDEVLRAARAGQHLKPTDKGYIGAPRTVTSPQGLGAMRRNIDKDFSDAVEAVRLADPTRLGTWYDRAKQGIAESVEPYQLPRTLEQHGVYSAGVSPESELTFALKHLNSRVAGDPQMAYRGAGMRNLDEAVAENRPAKMGFKIGEYAEKNDPRVPNEGLFGVNDFRRAQGMGYTDPQGNPWKAGVSDTMHPFMDAETALQVDRANTAGIGGRTDWAGPQIQEVPWVYGKGQDQYSRGKKGRYGGDELEGIKLALKDANNTARDYMYKHAASATHEQVPGASIGHVRQVLDMTPEEKLAYGREGRFDMPPPEYALSDMGEVGAGNRDAIYGALGYRQLPSREASGLYKNKVGGVETNPMTIARPLMDFPTGGGGGRMAEDSSRVMDAAEQFRALMDAQEAGAYNLPNTMSGVKGKNSMVYDTRGRSPEPLADPSAGVLPTSEQLAKMGDVMGDYGFGVTATNRGAVAFPFDSSMNPKEASSAFRKTGKAMEEIFPSSQEKAITSTGYVPGVGKRGSEGPLSTVPYSGEATSDLLSAFADLNPNVAQNLSESESVRAAIRAKALRDSKLGGARGDIQETRRFFSEADWPKAVAMMRKGMSPAAALAALGYNIKAMAADEK